MSTEDLRTYDIEPDPLDYTTITEDRAAFASFPRNCDEYVHDDKGVDHFAGDFAHLLTVYLESATPTANIVVWGLCNTIDDFFAIWSAPDFELAISFYAMGGPVYAIRLWEADGDTIYYDAYEISLETPYYLRVRRDEAVGEFGTLYCDIYSDEARTNKLTTLSCTLHVAKDYRYIYAIQSENLGSSNPITGYMECLDLQEAPVGLTMAPLPMFFRP